MPRRPLPRLGGGPGDPAALLELHHMVLPDAALSQRHREHVACPADPLAGGGLGQVVVAVPARLHRRIRDQLEDLPRPGRDLTAGADHPRRLLLSCHTYHPSTQANGVIGGRADGGELLVAAGPAAWRTGDVEKMLEHNRPASPARRLMIEATYPV